MLKEKKKTIKIVLSILLLLNLGFLGYFQQSKVSNFISKDTNAHKYNLKIKKTEDWPKTKIAYPSFGPTKIVEGTTKLYIALQNPKFNEANLQYTLYLDKEHQLIKTRLIEPSEAVTEVSLPKDLTAGEHIIYVHTKAFAPNDTQTGSLTSTNLLIIGLLLLLFILSSKAFLKRKKELVR